MEKNRANEPASVRARHNRKRTARSCPRWIALGWIIGSLPLGGCISGSLASNSGPLAPGHQWSTVPRQLVHVGETVDFDFVLTDRTNRLVPPLGLADYIAVDIRGQRLEVEPDVTGHFTFKHRFDAFQPGEVVKVKATAYRQRQARDFMKVGDQWYHNDSPFDMTDGKIAADTLRIALYQVDIAFRLPRPRDDLDPESGVLKIHGPGDKITSIYVDRPHRRGFRITGPDERGYYAIDYRPAGDELNRTGATKVEFVIYDVAGTSHHLSQEVQTP